MANIHNSDTDPDIHMGLEYRMIDDSPNRMFSVRSSTSFWVGAIPADECCGAYL